MEFFIEVAYGTLIKHGEELPGDMVNVIRLEDCTIVVLADGLGSGVKAYISEYDNPPIFSMRNGESMGINKKEVVINGKIIKESNLNLEEGHVITAVTDGVIHAGLGEILNLGWQWKDVKVYLKKGLLMV